MTEASWLWTTSGAGDGTAASYTREELAISHQIIAGCQHREGPLYNYLNWLHPSVAAVNTVAVASGAALVDGIPYRNTASVNVNVPSASGAGNTRIDLIVLRASWAAQTVRITRVAGTDAVTPVAPTLTQTTGVTYDIPLCSVLVNTGGTCIVTDTRVLEKELPIEAGAIEIKHLGPGVVADAKKLISKAAGTGGLEFIDDDFCFNFLIGSGVAVISTGIKLHFEVPCDCVIEVIHLVADAAGSIVIDIWKDTFANFPPTVADTITAAAKPTLSSAQKYENSTLVGWTVALSKSDWLVINVDSATTVKQVTLSILGRKTALW